jgi:hypothetical protein
LGLLEMGEMLFVVYYSEYFRIYCLMGCLAYLWGSNELDPPCFNLLIYSFIILASS